MKEIIKVVIFGKIFIINIYCIMLFDFVECVIVVENGKVIVDGKKEDVFV